MSIDDSMLVLGLDGGGSHTVCVAVEPPGVVAGRGEGGPSNATTCTGDVVRRSWRDAIGSALSGTSRRKVVGLCAAVAGSANPAAFSVAQNSLRGSLTDLGLDAEHIAVSLIPDAYAALVCGARSTSGIVAVAGTGSIVWGRDQEGEIARADGWGYLLGDDGSGYAMGRATLRAVMRSFDGRGTPTFLTELVMRHFAVLVPDALVERAYLPPLSVADVASIALPVFEAAESGDSVALDIVRSAAEGIQASVEAVAAKLRFAIRPTPLVLAGGLFQHRLYRQGVEALLRKWQPELAMQTTTTEPAVGAAWLALSVAGLDGPLGARGVAVG